jgi:hypothetical protein
LPVRKRRARSALKNERTTVMTKIIPESRSRILGTS